MYCIIMTGAPYPVLFSVIVSELKSFIGHLENKTNFCMVLYNCVYVCKLLSLSKYQTEPRADSNANSG